MGSKTASWVVGVILLLVCLVLVAPVYPGIISNGYYTMPDEWHESLTWLKDNTPVEARVIAWWEYGYWIEYTGEREAVITPSQESGLIPQVAKFLLSKDEPIPPSNATYIIIDDETMGERMLNSMATWGGFSSLIGETETMLKRLYNETPPDNYKLVFDNGVMIYEYTP